MEKLQTSLELKLISGQNLYDVNFSTKMDVYAVISVIGGDSNKVKQMATTSVVRKCGANPTFNFPVGFTLDYAEYALLTHNLITLKLELFCKGFEFDKDQVIGTVNVQLKELFDSSDPNDMKLISRPVTLEWRPYESSFKGELTFSYKFGEVKPVYGFQLVQQKQEEKKNKSVMVFAAGLIAGLMIVRLGNCGSFWRWFSKTHRYLSFRKKY